MKVVGRAQLSRRLQMIWIVRWFHVLIDGFSIAGANRRCK